LRAHNPLLAKGEKYESCHIAGGGAGRARERGAGMARFLWFTLIAVLLGVAPGFALAQAQKSSDPPVFLSGGALVDVIRGEVYPDVGVLAQGGKITGLFFDFPYNAARIPANAVRIDVRGKYLIPGMMDLHVHAQDRYKGVAVDLAHMMKIFLVGGVTTIRAMGTAEDNLVRLKHDIDTGRIAGPNIVVGSAPAFEQAPGFPRVERTDIVNNAVEARAITRDHIFKGAAWVKFYNYGDHDIVRAVVDEAHKHGAKVFGHFTMIGADEAARLGVDTLEHTVSLIQKNLNYQEQIGMTDIGYYRYFVLWTKVDEKKLDETFKVMIAHRTALVPTLAIQYVGADPNYLPKVSGEWFDLYQKDLYAAYLKDPLRVPAVYNFKAHEAQWKESILAQARQVARFVKMGGRVATGSDLSAAPPLVPGLSIRQELELFVQGGMTPLEALRSATIVPAEVLGWPERFG
jgi:imidazolonepropionase-like amidohydrolase